MYTVDSSLGSYATAGLSGTYIPEIWSGNLIVKFYQATVFTAIANTDYEGEITSAGDKVIIRTVPDITIRKYKIGQSLNYERPQSGNVELLIDKGNYYAVAINDVEKKQADINYVDKWAEDAAEGMKIAVDTDVLGDVPGDVDSDNTGASAGAISGAVDLGAAGTDGSDAVSLSKTTIVDKVVECGQVLDEQNIPQSNRWFVLPAWACTRIKISELAEASYSGDGVSTKRNGRIGKIDHFELYSSNNITPVLETVTNCYKSIFGHKSAITFASQLVKNEMIPNPDDFGKLMRGLQVYGYEVIKPESMGMLYCKAG
jgi:hypothetical protein